MNEVQRLRPSQRLEWVSGTLDAIRDNPHVAEVLPVLHDTARDLAEQESTISQGVVWSVIIAALPSSAASSPTGISRPACPEPLCTKPAHYPRKTLK